MSKSTMPRPKLDKLTVKIERATPDDAEIICDIRDRAWLKAYPNADLGITIDDIRIMARGRDGEFVPRRIAFLKEQFAKYNGIGLTTFVAKVDNKVVGYIDPRIDDYNHRRIGAIYVAPEFQGMGVGGKLLRWVLDLYGRDQDIYLEVVSYNKNAIDFYKRFGFEQTDAIVPEEEGRPEYLKSLPQIEMVLKAKTTENISKKQDVKIEKAIVDDAKQISELLRRTWLATYPNAEAGITYEDIRLRTEGKNGERIPLNIAKWRKRIEEDDSLGAVFVARLQGEIVGLAAPSVIDGTRYVGALYVLPEYQGMGVGGKLMDKIIQWHGNTDDIYLRVASYNQNAIIFYKRFGFEQTDNPVIDEGNVYGNTKIPEIEMVLKAKFISFKYGDNVLAINYIETQKIKDGVECDIYEFKDDKSKDLAIIRINGGHKSPKQRILLGYKTIQCFIEGAGTLTVQSVDGQTREYSYTNNDLHANNEVVVEVGQIMQWHANKDTDLTYYEICEPPYTDGRFEDLID